MARSLVVYYSRKGENFFPGGIRRVDKGNTAYAAEFLSKATGADLYEVDTVKPYAENYRACCMEAAAEAKSNARPAIKGYVRDISKYDAIFVCYPNWCGTLPMCLLTFLEHYDLSGKRIIPVCTNEGSGFANSIKDLSNSCTGAIIEDGLSLLGHQCAQSEMLIAEWAKTKV
jgi:flavodoxin